MEPVRGEGARGGQTGRTPKTSRLFRPQNLSLLPTTREVLCHEVA